MYLDCLEQVQWRRMVRRLIIQRCIKYPTLLAEPRIGSSLDIRYMIWSMLCSDSLVGGSAVSGTILALSVNNNKSMVT